MKIVALVDPYRGGHHIAFMRYFSRALLTSGHSVIILQPNAQTDVIPWLEMKYSGDHEVWNYDYQLPAFKNIGRAQWVITLRAFTYWKHLKKVLRKVEAELNLTIDLVFFAWLDSYLANYLAPSILGRIFPYYWAGLYFHPRHLRLENNMEKLVGLSEVDVALSAKLCKGVAVHDSGIIDVMTKRYPNKRIVWFPEIADSTAPRDNYPLSNQIIEGAKDRSIVGMIGLTKQQGLLTLMRLAKVAPAEFFYFVFVGRFNDRDMTASEKVEWHNFVQHHSEDCFFHFHSIPEGEEYNAVFNCFDIPFIVYENFTSTSNRLTKAANFHKPVLANDDYIIGEEVKKYNLGLTVKSGDVDQCLEAISELRSNQWNSYNTAQFRLFAELNSLDKLPDCFGQFLY